MSGRSLMAARDFVHSADALPDDEIWQMAILFVGLAGVRASRRRRDDVNNACKVFAEAMHELVGTPKFKDPSHAG
jgi:hypothetical protein